MTRYDARIARRFATLAAVVFLGVAAQSVVLAQSATVTSQPATVTSQPATVTSQPATVTSQPATVTSQPATVTSQPATAADKPAGDEWVPGRGVFPAYILTNQVKTNGFESLHAEVVAERLSVLWTGTADTNLSVSLLASEDKPGHWPARDWHAYAMIRAGESWVGALPVEDLDIPLVYFVWSSGAGATNVSPMRVCSPRDAGLETPTRIFWPFLEGFEEGTESWTLLDPDPDTPALGVSAISKSGKAALLVGRSPEQKRSTTVGTTRLRGPKIVSVGATGVTLWMRTVQGAGRARFTLYANAFGTNQVAATLPKDTPLTSKWRKVDLLFESFEKVPVAGVDYLAIELIADDATGFLLDDMQLLGPWATD